VASLTIRNLDESLKKRFRKRAREHGRSMSEEAGEILKSQLKPEPKASDNWVLRLREIVAPYGYLEIPEVPDEPVRDLPTFD
jgi:plasmid stability protein